MYYSFYVSFQDLRINFWDVEIFEILYQDTGFMECNTIFIYFLLNLCQILQMLQNLQII